MEIRRAHAGAAVHDYRKTVRLPAHILNHVKIQLRRLQIDAVRGAEGAGQRIDSGLGRKLPCELRIRVDFCLILFAALIPRAGFPPAHGAQLGLHGSAVFLCHLHSLFRIRRVFRVGKRRAVVHDPGKADLKGLLQVFQRLTVVQVHADRHLCLLCLLHHDGSDQGKRDPGLVTLGKHDNDGKIQLLRGPQDCPQALQVRCVEGADGDFLLLCNLQDFFQCY